jgi:hypothetical protein
VAIDVSKLISDLKKKDYGLWWEEPRRWTTTDFVSEVSR